MYFAFRASFMVWNTLLMGNSPFPVTSVEFLNTFKTVSRFIAFTPCDDVPRQKAGALVLCG
jgi:hypothetical protein